MIVGIDPGLSGAVAFLRPSDGALHLFPMPVKRFAKSRSTIDAKAFYDLMVKYVPNYNATILIEKVWAGVFGKTKRTQGASSAFSFGRSAGIVVGVSNSFPHAQVHEIYPAVWKACLGLSADKSECRLAAGELFPLKKAHFSRAKDDGKAEAALIAHFGRLKYLGPADDIRAENDALEESMDMELELDLDI